MFVLMFWFVFDNRLTSFTAAVFALLSLWLRVLSNCSRMTGMESSEVYY
jgi:hypothetical protein